MGIKAGAGRPRHDGGTSSSKNRRMELVCPAGGLPALRAAVDNGADAVYIGFRDDTNARHFPGLNFDPEQAAAGIAYARDRGVRVYLALNTYPQAHNLDRWLGAVDRAAELGVDALICADIAVLDHARRHHPKLPLHLSVQASATTWAALRFYHEHFGVRRAVLPRVLSLAQIETLVAKSPVAIEVFGFGGLCVMVEGRCSLSALLSGAAPNLCGVCSPAEAVRFEDTPEGLVSRLGGWLIDRFAPGERAGYPTVCKGRYRLGGHVYYAFEEPTSLNTLDLLPALARAGVAAIKIEGRQRSPAYVAAVTRIWRAALDALAAEGGAFVPRPAWQAALTGLSEGRQTTLGAYHRPWR
ncbi:MAG: protease [Gammaproteobacteria bacterium]|nr:MAG: protease [Gammaproteobacteria bacterium]